MSWRDLKPTAPPKKLQYKDQAPHLIKGVNSNMFVVDIIEPTKLCKEGTINTIMIKCQVTNGKAA